MPEASMNAEPQARDDGTVLPPDLEWKCGCFGLWPGSRYVVIESEKSPEELKADLRAALGPVWDIFTPGLKGWVLGPWVRVGWLPQWSRWRERSHLAFRGWLVKSPNGMGCSLRGYIRMHALLPLVLGLESLLMLSFLFLFWGGPHPWRNVATCAAAIAGITWVTGLGAKAAVREIHARLTAICAR